MLPSRRHHNVTLLLDDTLCVLCALGDATTAVRDESARTYIRKFSETNKDEIARQLKALGTVAAKGLASEKVPAAEIAEMFGAMTRPHMGMLVTVPIPEQAELDAVELDEEIPIVRDRLEQDAL